MKQLILFACLSLFTFSLSAQVFVDIDAAGTGDGTSWANAYTNLNDALLEAAPGSEVWIADGTYITPDTASFFVNKALTILGGFNGTEMSADAADPATNVVILSGDVDQNDVQGSFDSLSRVDNQPVMFFQDTNDVSAFSINLSGVTIQDGNLEGTATANGLGGGLLTFARCTLDNVVFRANFAQFGSAIFTGFRNTDGSLFDNITVEDNYILGGNGIYNLFTQEV
ncbi:MAG: hypothetical protein AAF597_07145, partial [Bacteroidota bacterium]